MSRRSITGTPFRSKARGASMYASRVTAGRTSFANKYRPTGPAGGFVRGARPGFAQIASVVRGMGIRGETKSVDVQVNSAAFAATSTNPNSTSLTLIQEGAGFWNRIGRKACLKSLQVTGWIQPNFTVGVAATLVNDMCRYIIFFDKQPNGVAATWNQIVQNYDNAGNVTNTVNDGINLDNRDRFVILRDRKVRYGDLSISAGGTDSSSFPSGTSIGSVGMKDGSDGGSIVKEYIKLGGIEAQFNGTANPATVAQISTGNLGIIFASLGGTAAATQYNFIGSFRLRFTDC